MNAPTLTRAEQLRLIREFYRRLESILPDRRDWVKHGNAVRANERQQASNNRGITVCMAVKLFTVRQVFRAFVTAGEQEKLTPPDPAAALWLRWDTYTGYALAMNNAGRIKSEFTILEMETFVRSVDFVTLNRGEA